MDNDKGTAYSSRHLCQNLPAFDVKQALIRLDGDHDLYIQILRSYEQTFRPFSTTLRELAHAGNTEDMIQQLHTLKGAAANLEITQVRRLSHYLEDQLRQGADIFMLPEYQSLIAALETSFEQITAMGQKKIMNENTGRIFSHDELTAALHELHSMLSGYDTASGDVLFRIKPALIRLGLESEVSRLEKTISGYAFEKAEIVCRQLIQQLGDTD
ncbi:MAG: Hpt domain-containing protein [Desulfotignum sp.]|nr:Hpt domain-containing protein [Desulfotignum sp.]MCF8086726.1 Hpt domain-containing protein [Desulfotignum sp.]MCF8136508.1 Hpt domain-containing protein [Desulfotignum sp.]